MKRIMALLTALLVCAPLVCPAAAADNDFVPSISYKDGPGMGEFCLADIVETETPEDPDVPQTYTNMRQVRSCIVITTLTGAREKTTDIYQEERDQLLDIYDQLTEGTMTLPLEAPYVIRDLVDISFQKTPCVENDHTHQKELAQEQTVLTAVFDLDVAPETVVHVLVYVDGQWEPAKSVENTGDGKVTVVFENIGPVAFCVDAEPVHHEAEERARPDWLPWLILMITCFLIIIVLLIQRKKSKEEKQNR